MKQIFEGWTIATKINEMGIIEHTYFMGKRTNHAGNRYVTLEAYPTHVNVLKNLHETKEDAMEFWKTGMWDLCISRESTLALPVKIKVEIDVGCLGLGWNGI